MIPIADRTVRVSLLMEAAGYIQGAEAAARKTRELGSEAEKLAQKRQAFETLGRGALLLGAGMAAGVAVAVKSASDFSSSMSDVEAATHETADGMAKLGSAAIEAGRRTKFSATDAAGGIEELAKAGVKTKDILGGGLSGALNLAAAGELDVADAAGVAATAMSQFHLSGAQVPHVADLLAAAAGKAQGSVADMAQALNQSGLVASQMGLSIEETTGTLAAFAGAGLKGSDAGTSFRTMLLRLANPTGEAAQKMAELGLNVYDAQGHFVTMESLAGQLATRLHGVDEQTRNAALATIFGTDAIRGANVLYKEGAEGIQGWINKVNDSGYAAETAAIRMDNLSGDVEQLSGSMETALIKTGAAAEGMLRTGVQAITGLVNAYSGLPEPVQAAALGLGSLVAGVGLVGGAFLLAVPRVAEFKNALESLDISGKRLVGTAGAIGLAIAGATFAIGFWSQRAAEAQAVTGQLSTTLDIQTGAVTNATRAIVTHRLEEAGAFEMANQMGISQRQLTDALLAGGSQWDAVRGKIDAYQGSQGAAYVMGNLFSGHLFTMQGDLDDLAGSVEGAREGWQNEAAANAEADAAAQRSQDALAGLAGQAQSATVDINTLADTIRGFASGELSARDAARQFEEAIDSATDAVAQNGATLDTTTAEGRANEAALDGIAKAALNAAGAILEQSGSEDNARAAIQRGRDALIAQIGTFGITGEAADAYADKLGLIPDNVGTAVNLQDNASAKLANIGAQMSNLDGRVASIMVRASLPDLNGVASGSGRPGMARGGILPGRPSAKDNMLIHAASGEFITRAASAAVPSNRRALEYMNAGGVIQGFADGGMVDAGRRGVFVDSSARYAPAPAAPAPKFTVLVTSKGGIDLLKYVDVRVESSVEGAFDEVASDRDKGFSEF